MSTEPKQSLPPKRNRKTLKAIAAVTAVLVGVSVASVAATIGIYDSFFSRYERPDYGLYPGMYSYERYGDTLPRESFFIPSGENDLCAYYYPTENPRALAVAVHGFHAGADDLLPMIERLTQEGYAVLSYDGTATYSSTGDSGIGMCQFICDLDAVLSYISADVGYSSMPLVLIGHSLGGNAVASVLPIHREVQAVVCIAPMNDASTLMVETGRQYVSYAAYTVKPIFDAYQDYLFGEFTEYNGIRGINSTDIPVLIAQGLNDGTIPHDTLAMTAYLDEITNSNLSIYYAEGLQGTHTGIWHSEDAEEYAAQVQTALEQAEEEKGEELTYEEKVAFYQTIDHHRYSAVNEELFQEIFQTFEKGLSS